jgi:hypothetical protein
MKKIYCDTMVFGETQLEHLCEPVEFVNRAKLSTADQTGGSTGAPPSFTHASTSR